MWKPFILGYIVGLSLEEVKEAVLREHHLPLEVYAGYYYYRVNKLERVRRLQQPQEEEAADQAIRELDNLQQRNRRYLVHLEQVKAGLPDCFQVPVNEMTEEDLGQQINWVESYPSRLGRAITELQEALHS